MSDHLKPHANDMSRQLSHFSRIHQKTDLTIEYRQLGKSADGPFRGIIPAMAPTIDSSLLLTHVSLAIISIKVPKELTAALRNEAKPNRVPPGGKSRLRELESDLASGLNLVQMFQNDRIYGIRAPFVVFITITISI